MANSANSLNIKSAGIPVFDGTATFTESTTTQYNVLVGSTSNAIANVAPSATSGVPLISQGNAANPAFGTAVVAGGGTGAVSFTAHGVILGEGTSPLGVTAAGTTGQVLTGVTGSDPVWASPASSSITITGDTGGGLTGTSFTFTGGTTGLSFGGSGSTETITVGNFNLPGTANNASSGVITFGGNRIISCADDHNVYVGENSGTYPNGQGIQYNVGIGYQAMNNLGDGASRNIAIGYQALITSGSGGTENIAIGRSTLSSLDNTQNVSGFNIAIGSFALSGITIGNSNIAIGVGAGSNYTTSESGNLCIGSVGIVTESSAIHIGDQGSYTTTYIAGISGVTPSVTPSPVFIDTNGQLGTGGSPAFLAQLNSATANNVTGDGTNYTVICDLVRFDKASNYNSGTGVFTAPITGTYFFNCSIMGANVTTQNFYQVTLITTPRNYTGAYMVFPAGLTGFFSLTSTWFVDLSASDTVSWQINMNGPASPKTVGINNGAFTWVSGYLVSAG